MDLRQLSYVVAVVDHDGFTAAATALHVAQPSLSQAIKALETELGVALFDRVGRKVRLTAAGRALLPAARQALRDIDIAREAVDAVRGVEGGRLDLVSIPTLGVSPVAEFIGAFRAAHPAVTVRLVEPDEAGAVAAHVMGGQSEIGFTELPLPTPGPTAHATRAERATRSDRGPAPAADRLTSVELASQEYVAVHHRSVERGALVSLPQLAELPLVTTTPGTSTRRLIDEAFRQAGCSPRIAIESDLREVIAAIVEAGGGYSILPRTVGERMAARGLGAVRVAEIVPTISRRIGLIHRPGTLSPAARAFLDLVRRSLPPD